MTPGALCTQMSNFIIGHGRCESQNSLLPLLAQHQPSCDNTLRINTFHVENDNVFVFLHDRNSSIETR